MRLKFVPFAPEHLPALRAFCARTCLRLSGMKHCSWISGMQEQREGKLLDGRCSRDTAEM